MPAKPYQQRIESMSHGFSSLCLVGFLKPVLFLESTMYCLFLFFLRSFKDDGEAVLHDDSE